MENNERAALIDQLDRSFQMMPTWVQTACKHSMGAPTRFNSFREAIQAADDQTLETLKDDFMDNGDLLDAVATQ